MNSTRTHLLESWTEHMPQKCSEKPEKKNSMNIV